MGISGNGPGTGANSPLMTPGGDVYTVDPTLEITSMSVAALVFKNHC